MTCIVVNDGITPIMYFSRTKDIWKYSIRSNLMALALILKFLPFIRMHHHRCPTHATSSYLQFFKDACHSTLAQSDYERDNCYHWPPYVRSSVLMPSSCCSHFGSHATLAMQLFNLVVVSSPVIPIEYIHPVYSTPSTLIFRV